MIRVKITVLKTLTYEDVIRGDVPDHFPPEIPAPASFTGRG